MVSLVTILTTLSVAVSSALAIPAKQGPQDLESRQTRFSQTYWENEFANVTYESGSGGQYTLDWKNGAGGNFVIGKGYSPARDMLFNYSGSWELQSNAWAYLALYGWTTNPLVEYYVIEHMGAHNPSDNAMQILYGMVESDGGTYEIWTKNRTNAPSIEGTSDYPQYWSVRTKSHFGGTINTGNHFRAWEAAGLKLGKQTSFNLAIEGQQGGGHADITVGVLPSTFPPETSTSTRRTAGPHSSTHYTASTTSTRPTSTSTRPTSTSTRPTSTSTRPTSTSTRPTSTSTRPTSTSRTSTSTRPTSTTTTRSSSTRTIRTPELPTSSRTIRTPEPPMAT